METILIPALKAPSTYKSLGFEKSKEITLADETNDRIEHFTRTLSFDANEKDQKMIDHLNTIKDNYQDIYNSVSFIEYTLSYEASNALGVPLADKCIGRFNSNGELVAIKITEKDSWTLLGNFFSIPNYYDML